VAYGARMSIEKPLRELVQAELRVRLAPMHKAIARMEERLGALDELADIIWRLSPLTKGMQSLRQLALPGLATPGAARGGPEARVEGRGVSEGRVPPPARPPVQDAVSAALLKAVRESDAAVAPPPRPERPKGHAVVVEALDHERRCAVIGCKRPARSKGYCSAHYQKLRLLVKTDRRPTSWVDDAAPQSVPEVVLPRGRAASREHEETPVQQAQPERPVPPPPPTPKAWVRKKGDKDKVEQLPLH
jgi:hypothetical protein